MEQNSDEETIGFIDVGTNSIHLLVVRFYPDSSGTPVFQDKESVRLGKSLYSTGRITREAIDKSALVISRFARISRGLGADRVIAFATCAAREADNRQELIDAVSGNVELKVIPGTEEARLIALGVFGDKGPAERTLEIDIGGGSTEVIVREKGEDIFLDSLSMGAVRFNYSLGVDCSQRVSPEDYALMMRTVDISSYHAVNRIQSIGFRRAVGSSGTLLSIAEMCGARREDRDQTYFTRKELHSLMQDLCAMTAEERLRVPGMGKTRADIIIPGGAIAEELMSLFGVSRMDVSTNGLKQGMMLDHQLSHGYTVFSARQSSVRALAHRCQYDRRHAETVERNAMSLFDQSRELGLHELDVQWRSLLSCACILHDIGELISYTNHNVLSQVIIEKADLQGFTCEEITAMGLIVRFHHKKFPGPKDSRLSALPKNDARAVRVCAMLLKMADVMDRHRNNAVRSARMRVEGSKVVLSLSADEDPSMEIWSLERLRPDFQKLFGLDLVPVSVDPLPGREPVGMQVGEGKAGSASRSQEPDSSGTRRSVHRRDGGAVLQHPSRRPKSAFQRR